MELEGLGADPGPVAGLEHGRRAADHFGGVLPKWTRSMPWSTVHAMLRICESDDLTMGEALERARSRRAD
jgi:hypothetical protein